MKPLRTTSAVIPTLDAARTLGATLHSLAEGALAETIVVDGGSTDVTVRIATNFGARVIAATRGRGSQLAAGVAAASAEWLLLLHADTRLAPGWTYAAEQHIASDPGRAAYFHFVLASTVPAARRLERMVAWRCRLLALPYGDQGLLIHRDLLEAVGGIRPLPLMEDVDLIRRLGRHRLAALDATAITAADRFERDGWLARSLRNLACLSLYFAGIPPRLIARFYR